MDSKEEILTALDEFNRKATDKVPPLLERYLHRIAATGETLFAWPKLEQLFIHKLDLAMKEFFEKVPTDGLPNCPNVENVTFEEMRQRLLKAVTEFSGAPFTIQRLCELITNPQKHYKRTDKFMRGIEKNLLVVSTVDPYGNKIVRENSKTLVNGLDANGYENDKLSPDTPERHFCPPPAPTSSPNTNGNHGDSAAMSGWFPGTSTDTVCPWGGGGGGSGQPLMPSLTTPAAGDGPSTTTTATTSSTPSSSSSTPPESSASTSTTNTPATCKEAELALKEATPATELSTKEAGPGTEIAESSSSSSSSSSSDSSSASSPPSQSITPPLGEVDKESADSNESIDTSDSSSSEGSSTIDVEADQQQQSQANKTDPPVPATAPAPAPAPAPVVESSTAPTPAPAPAPDPSNTQNEAIPAESPRESAKRPIEQHHTETQNKRPRIEDSEEAGSSEPATPSDSAQSTPSEEMASTGDDQTEPSAEVTSPSEEEDKPTEESVVTSEAVESAVSEETEKEPVAAEVQEGRDSQDSLGFDTPVQAEADVDSTDSVTKVESSPPPSSSDDTPASSSTGAEQEAAPAEPLPAARKSEEEEEQKADVSTTDSEEPAGPSSENSVQSTTQETTEVSSTVGNSDVNSTNSDTSQINSDVTSQSEEASQSSLPTPEAMDVN